VSARNRKLKPAAIPQDLESRYRKIFETAEVGLWEEDYSQVRMELELLRQRGVSDFRDYFSRNPQEVVRLAALIRVLDANAQALKFHGAKSLAQLEGSLEKISVPEALPAFSEALAAIAEGKASFESEVPGRTLEGQKVYSFIRFSIPRLDAEFERLIVSTVDITQRKLTELALKNSEDRYRSIFENAKVSLWENDFSASYEAIEQMKRQGVSDFRRYLEEHPAVVKECLGKIRVLDVNRETLRLYKANSKEQLLGALESFIRDETIPAYREELVAIAEGRAYFEGEQKDFNLEGEEMAILVSYAIPHSREEFNRVVVSITDITARKRVEEEQLKVQRLESLGVLAGGIAHDFNNLLTAVLGNISLWKHQKEMGLEGSLEQEQLLEETVKAITRARGLTEQLLTFSKGGRPLKRLVALRQLLAEAVSFALSGSNVEPCFDIAEDLLDAELDEGQFTQVINNLVINARQAMTAGGRLEIRAGNCVRGAGEQFVRIVFTDSGPGIPQANLSRIFDPYYSTKKEGKGLGLAVVYSIVRRHDGHIEVESEPGKGTSFAIYLPASARQSVKAEPEAPPRVDGLKVLVMDDDESVRAVAQRMLDWLHCSMIPACDGEQALLLYEQHRSQHDPIDVVIMDLTVPGRMGGKEAIGRLRALDPQVKAVVSSGYSNDPILSSYRDYGFQAVLTKPYDLQELQQVLGTLKHA
jgi:signal transduction histidine kinase/ActR/RegA family two-component response regulator